MALARVKTWSAGEVLLASDLNSEFNNILNNARSLISPLTGSLDMDGFELIMDGDADSSLTADTDDRLDVRLGGVDVFRFDGTTASVVNGIDFIGTVTGTRPRLVATGDTNTGISIRAKGTSTGAVTVIEDGNGNEVLIADVATASAINEITITNAALNNPPAIKASGGDTNISLKLQPKGTGTVNDAVGVMVPTGVVMDYVGSSAPTGWVLLSGRTIGDATSGGSERANADTELLFTLIWNSMADSEAPVSTGRGASAAADFAAHKTITLPDGRGRAVFGKDNMGGSTASRVTNGNSGITATTLGVSGGDERLFQHQHSAGTLSADSGGAHTHNVDGYDNAGALTRLQADLTGAAVAATVATTSNGAHTHTVSGSTANAGGNTTSQNMPPALILNKIVKL